MKRAGRRFPITALCLASALAWTLEVRPEVGVVFNASFPSTELTGPYNQIIVDDPDPLGIWTRYSSHPSRLVLNEQGDANGDGPPSMLRNPVSGLPIVAWARNSPNGYDVVVSSFSVSGGSWSTPQVVAGSSDDELDPALILAPNGDVHLVYWVDSGTTRTVVHRYAPPDLSSWSAPAQVSAVGDEACRPAGVYHAGELHIAYEVHPFGFGSTPRDVVVTRWNGTSYLPEVVAVTHNSQGVWPRVHDHAGTMWIDWIDDHDAAVIVGEAAWRKKDGPTQWGPPRYEPFGSEAERDFGVRGAIRVKATQGP